MRKKRNKVSAFLIDTVVPFLTVAVIVTIALAIFVMVNRVSNGNTTLIVVVMIVTIFVLSLAFLVGDKLKRKITIENPVKEILEATERIAKGDFSVRLSTIRSYEKYNDYDLIKENLNDMAKELEKSAVLKTDFISNVSHELKTPLANVQNYMFLLQGDLDNETKQKYVKICLEQTKRLTNLINNVLKLNKLENQNVNFEKENFRLDELLAQSILAFEERFNKKNINLDCDLSEITVHSSQTAIEIVFSNLLSNAIKFTDEGGSVFVSLKKQGKNAVVSVKDTGIGISFETGAKIFDKFYQGDTSHSGEGNGLGLALVKKVIDVLGGQIAVKSQVGKGSTFTVTLKDVINE